MNHHPHQALQAFAGTDKVAGCWKLAEGRALTLQTRSAGVLRIAHGVVWITLDNAQRDDGVRGGDHFLGAGDVLHMRPGQTLVMESWKAEAHSSAYFSWDPLPASAAVSVAHTRVAAFARSYAANGGLLQPLRDLRAALGLAVGASGRLMAGLALAPAAALLGLMPRFAIDLIACRARGAPDARAFKAHSSDSRAHCA